MQRTVRFAAVAALALAVASVKVTPAAAQVTANASVNAIANIVGIAGLTAAGINDLNFGTTNAGTPATPANLAANAARFAVTGQPNTGVLVNFTLPTVLTGPGSTTIPVSFGGSDGLLWVSYPGVFTTFNPHSAYSTALDFAGNLTIGLTGTVSPPLGTTTGVYTGTITLTVSY